MICAMFGWNWLSGSEEVKNEKVHRHTDKQKNSLAFSVQVS
jgi:hypothetical protein